MIPLSTERIILIRNVIVSMAISRDEMDLFYNTPTHSKSIKCMVMTNRHTELSFTN